MTENDTMPPKMPPKEPRYPVLQALCFFVNGMKALFLLRNFQAVARSVISLASKPAPARAEGGLIPSALPVAPL